MTSLAIDSAATMQLTCRNRFKRSFSGGYKVTNGNRVRKLEGDPDAMGLRYRAVSQRKLAVQSNRVEDGKW